MTKWKFGFFTTLRHIWTQFAAHVHKNITRFWASCESRIKSRTSLLGVNALALYPHFPQLLSDFDEIWYKRSARNAVGNHRKRGRPFLMHTHACIVKHYDMSKIKNACVLRHAVRHLLLSRLPATSAPLGPHRTTSGLHRQLYDDGRHLCYVLINELQNFLTNGTKRDSCTLSLHFEVCQNLNYYC